MGYSVTIHNTERQTEKYYVEAKTNLLRFLQSSNADIASPCGGARNCGKCKIRLTGRITEPCGSEKTFLSEKQLDEGYRLACCTDIDCDVELYLGCNDLSGIGDSSIDCNSAVVVVGVAADNNTIVKHAAIERNVALAPYLRKKLVKLNEPALSDQTADVQRVLGMCGEETVINDLALIGNIPDVLRNSGFEAVCILVGKRLIDVRPSKPTSGFYGIAFDIGTTTIAAYLCDLETGERVDSTSSLNPQKKYGADVISRIDHTIKYSDGSREMNRVVITAINSIIETFSERNEVSHEDIYAAAFVGNTTMMHFLMGLPAKNIAVAPFISATTGCHILDSKDLGLSINRAGVAICAPGVSSFIGADAVAASLACNMSNSHDINMMIDIGTNGEITLGCDEWMYACSTAAGPAFEGASIRCGVGGVEGAIDSVRIQSDVEFTTIGNKKAVGICGSGLVDLIAELLTVGIIDETGRLLGSGEVREKMSDELSKVSVEPSKMPDKLSKISDKLSKISDKLSKISDELSKRLVSVEGMNSFVVTRSSEKESGVDIVLTQKDVREMQNAKAAIAAGIKTIIRKSGIGFQDVANVYLAGGFGNNIDKINAVKIGLIPAELGDRIVLAGNAAGSGAIESLLSERSLKEMLELCNRMNYIELSASSEFADEYIECLTFE